MFTFDKMLHQLEKRNANIVYEVQERLGSSPKGCSNHEDRALMIGDRIFFDEPIVQVCKHRTMSKHNLSVKAQVIICKLCSSSSLHRGQCVECCAYDGSALALTQS